MTSKYLYTWMQRMAALLLVFIGSSAFAVADTKLYIEDFSISAGETKEVAVCLDTDVDDFRMTSMTITLPTGLSFETVDIGLGKPVIAATVNTSRAVGFSAIGSPETGKISMSSLSGNIAAGTGTLFTFKVKAADNLAVTSTIQLVGGELTRRGDGSKYNEANNNLEIGNATVNKLGDLSVKFAEETITMDPSGTYSMAVNMSNIGKAVVGFQADLVLPAGWTATITDGRLINSGTGYRIQYNDLTTPIPGEEGTIFTINLVAPSTFTTGSVEVKLKDIFVTVGTSEQQLADAKLTVNANGGAIPGKPVVTFTKPSAVIGGGKTGNVDVNMLNVGLDVKGFQADIVLPEGWTVQVVNGRMINMGSGNRVMYSDFMNSIPGEDGILFSLALTPPESFVSGDAIVKLTNILTTVGFKEEALSDISITVNAATLNNIVNEALADATEDVVIVTMDGDNLCDGAVVVPTGKQLVLDGANHSLTLGEATNFTICDGITIKNVNIDAAALTKPLVQMNGTPEIEPVESGQYVIKNAITFDNVKATGLTKNLFSDNSKAYVYEQFNINNSIFEYSTQTGVVLNLGSSMAINFNITNSTFWSKEAGTANFIAMSGKRPWQVTGYEEETGKMTVANSTFYNVGKSKQFMNTNTLKGQKYLYEFNSNIFANVSNKKIYGNMTNNKKQLTTDGKNTYFFDGEFFAETNYNGDEGLQTDPAFADAAAGDFTIGAITLQAKEKTGDPRWLVEYSKGTFSALVADALAGVESGEATLKLIDDYDVDAAVTVPAGKQLVLDGANHSLTLGEATNFTICDGITIKNVNIDAAALTKPLVQMNGTPEIEPVESGQYVIKNAITFDNVKATGLTKNLFSDNSKAYVYEQFNINNSIFEYSTQTGVVLNLGSSMAINFNITNSTFWSKEAGTANFIAMSGKRPWQVTGYEEETGKMTVANSTFYNVGKSKQFMNTNTLKGQKYLYEFNSNIFVDVSNKKIYGNMTNNAKQLTTDGKNTYFFDGASFAETNYNGDEGLQTDPSFADATTGDFTIGESTKQAREKTGDPRWLTEFVAPTDVDKTALAATITEAEALSAPVENDPDATKTAWAAVTDALTKAQAVNADANVFQDEVDAANTALANAIAAYNTATGITDINIDNNTVAGEKDVYYNLQGVRVANPGKGIYIKNGKKVLVK